MKKPQTSFTVNHQRLLILFGLGIFWYITNEYFLRLLYPTGQIKGIYYYIISFFWYLLAVAIYFKLIQTYYFRKFTKDTFTYSSMIQDIQTGVIIYQSDFQIRMINSKAKEMLEISDESNFSDFFRQNEWKFYDNDMQLLRHEDFPLKKVFLSSIPIRDFIFGIKKSPDKPFIDFWFQVNVDLIKINDNKELNFILSISDITNIKKNEEILRKNEKRYSMAQSISHSGNWEYNIQTGEFWGSEEAKTIYGFDLKTEFFTTEEVENCIPDRENVHQALLDLIEKNQPYNLEFEIHPKNSKETKVIKSVAELTIDEKGFSVVVGVIQDITQKKLVELALEKREKEMKEAQRLAKIGNWDWDSNTDKITWSDEYYRIFGFDPAFDPPGYLEHLKAYTDDSAQRLDQAVKKNMETGDSYEIDLELANPEGSCRWITARSETKFDLNGCIIGLRGTAQDITERKFNEFKINRLNRALQMLNEINWALIHDTDESSLLNELCRTGVKVGGHKLIWVGYVEHDESKTIRPVAYYGIDSEYILNAKVSWDDTERGSGPGGTAIKTGVPCIIKDLSSDSFAPWRSAAIERGFKSIIALPLKNEKSVFGVVGIYSDEVEAFDDNEVEILIKLTDNLAFGINTIRMKDLKVAAERNLERQFSTLRSIIDSTDSIIFSVDTNYNYTAFNKAHFNMMQRIYNTEIEIGHNLFDCMTVEEDMLKAKNNLDKALNGISQTEESYSGEKELSRRYFSVSHNPIITQETGVIGVAVYARDITDRILTEITIQKTQKITVIMNNISNAFLSFPGDEVFAEILSIVMINIKCDFGLFGFLDIKGDLIIPSLTYEIWQKCRIENKSFVFPKDTWGDSIWGKAIMEKKVYCSSGPFSIPKGHVEILNFLSVPVVYDNESIGLICLANSIEGFSDDDIEMLKTLSNYISPILKARLQRNYQESKRKQAEDEVIKLSKGIEQSPLSVIITNYEGIIQYVNPKFCEVTGYSKSEVIGKNPNLLKSGYTSSLEYKILWDTIKSGNVWKGEFYTKKKNKEFIWESATISPIITPENIITHFIAIKEDITEKKKLLNDLVEAKDRAEESDKLKTAFLQNMSHEIRTPLNGIIGFSNLLNEKDLSSEEIKEYTKMIQSSGQRLIETVGNILDMSKIETGQTKINYSSFELNTLITDLYGFYSEIAKAKGLSFTYSLYFNEISLIFSDETKLNQILSNLLNNAIKFTLSGSVRFGYNLKDKFLEFFVEDTGIGIQEEFTNRIFSRFAQADLSVSRGYEGVGLGLSISKGLVELLGGRIWFKSEANKGTTFYFTIPYITKTDFSFSPTEASSLNVFPKKMKIMIAEDDYTSYVFLSTYLKKEGFEVLHAKDGLEAVECVKNTENIDLILMDIKMPIMNGIDATQKIKIINSDIPIIAQTAYAFLEDIENIKAAGCCDYISKPINIDNLLFLIGKYTC